MAIIRRESGQHQIFENIELGVLVAVDVKELQTIEAFRKRHKGKRILSEDKVPGFPFIFDIEQNSLKIDFSTNEAYEIRHLKKFD